MPHPYRRDEGCSLKETPPPQRPCLEEEHRWKEPGGRNFKLGIFPERPLDDDLGLRPFLEARSLAFSICSSSLSTSATLGKTSPSKRSLVGGPNENRV